MGSEIAYTKASTEDMETVHQGTDMGMDPSNRFTLRLRWLCYLSRRSPRSPQDEALIVTVDPQVDSHSTTSAPLPLGSCG